MRLHSRRSLVCAIGTGYRTSLAFKTQLSYVYGQYWRLPPSPGSEAGNSKQSAELGPELVALPERGDSILALGGKPIDVWPRLLRALIDSGPRPHDCLEHRGS